MPRGFFLTFEGLDGSGKTTQLRRLQQWLVERGEEVLATRQPGGTPLGDRIRSLLLDARRSEVAPLAELGLMFSDRAQAVAEVIRPALDRGAIVLCDRFSDSSEAYQGAGRQLGAERVLAVHRALCGLDPDMTLLLLPDLEVSVARARRRNQAAEARTGRNENRFESLDMDFFRRVHEQYRAIAHREPGRVQLLAGDEGVEAIHHRITALVAERLASHRAA